MSPANNSPHTSDRSSADSPPLGGYCRNASTVVKSAQTGAARQPLYLLRSQIQGATVEHAAVAKYRAWPRSETRGRQRSLPCSPWPDRRPGPRPAVTIRAAQAGIAGRLTAMTRFPAHPHCPQRLLEGRGFGVGPAGRHVGGHRENAKADLGSARGRGTNRPGIGARVGCRIADRIEAAAVEQQGSRVVNEGKPLPLQRPRAGRVHTVGAAGVARPRGEAGQQVLGECSPDSAVTSKRPTDSAKRSMSWASSAWVSSQGARR